MQNVILIAITVWYIFSLLLVIYLYFKDSKPYPFEKEVDVRNLNRSLEDLSFLVYKKIVPEVMTASIVKLIDGAKIKLTSENNIFWLTKLDDENLNRADFNLMELLFDVIGDGNRVSILQINNFCNKKRGNSEFLLNYQMWQKMSTVISNKGKLFNEKKEFVLVSIVEWLGIIIFILNMVFETFNLFGLFMIIPAILIKVYFCKISKLTVSATQEYYGWLEFRGKLKHDYTLFSNNQFLEYSILLKCYDGIRQEVKRDFIRQLDTAIRKCYFNSYFRGNRSLF